MIRITTLPDELQVDKSSAIQVYHYHSNKDLARSKINLQRNTISFLVSGTKEVIADHQSELIDSRQFIVMKAGNCLMTEKVSAIDKRYKSILLFFTDEIAIDFLERNQFPIQANHQAIPFRTCQYDAYIRHYVAGLEQLSRFPKKLQQQLLEAKFEEIMLYLSQKEGTHFLSSILQQQDPSKLRLRNVVENNRLKKLTLQELAFLCNMSVSTFKRAFYKTYEETPSKWFQEKRLEHSANLLRTQKKRPIDLFEEAGYENLSNFVQAFKKKYGKTPKQYQSQS